MAPPDKTPDSHDELVRQLAQTVDEATKILSQPVNLAGEPVESQFEWRVKRSLFTTSVEMSARWKVPRRRRFTGWAICGCLLGLVNLLLKVIRG